MPWQFFIVPHVKGNIHVKIKCWLECLYTLPYKMVRFSILYPTYCDCHRLKLMTVKLQLIFHMWPLTLWCHVSLVIYTVIWSWESLCEIQSDRNKTSDRNSLLPSSLLQMIKCLAHGLNQILSDDLRVTIGRMTPSLLYPNGCWTYPHKKIIFETVSSGARFWLAVLCSKVLLNSKRTYSWPHNATVCSPFVIDIIQNVTGHACVHQEKALLG